MPESLIIVVMVGSAACYLGWKLWRRFQSQGSCGGGCDCSGSKASQLTTKGVALTMAGKALK